MNIAWNAIIKAEHPELGYEVGFLDQLTECIDGVAAKGIKIVTNAGALNAPALSRKVEQLCESRGLHEIVVATVVGDDVTHVVKRSQSGDTGLKFRHLDHEEMLLDDWDSDLEPTCAAAYIGAW